MKALGAFFQEHYFWSKLGLLQSMTWVGIWCVGRTSVSQSESNMGARDIDLELGSIGDQYGPALVRCVSYCSWWRKRKHCRMLWSLRLWGVPLLTAEWIRDTNTDTEDTMRNAMKSHDFFNFSSMLVSSMEVRSDVWPEIAGWTIGHWSLDNGRTMVTSSWSGHFLQPACPGYFSQ